MFRAFADRTRLRILHLLQDGELCVSDIINILKVPQAKASHHLNYLRRAGLVEVRKQGLWCFYRLRPGADGLPPEAARVSRAVFRRRARTGRGSGTRGEDQGVRRMLPEVMVGSDEKS